MPYYPRYRGRGGGNYYDRRRERGWYPNRRWTPFRPRDEDSSERTDNHRYRRDRNEEVVLIRRDRGGEDVIRRDREKEEVKKTKQAPLEEVGTSVRRSPEKKNDKTYSTIVDGNIAREKSFLNYDGIPTPGECNSDFWRNPSQSLSHVPVNNMYIPLPQQPVELEKRCFPLHHETPIQTQEPELSPKQREIIDACISNFKTRGDYDRIRRECMLDIDTKPAFINAFEKVKDITKKFLETAPFNPNMNKAKMRENLKKSFELSRSYQNGIEALVNQILLPKISNVLQPMVENEIHKIFGRATTIGSTTPSTSNAFGDTKQEAQVEKDYANNASSENLQDLPSTTAMSYLLPMNIITDVKPESSSLPQNTTREIVSNEVDLQLHEDIMEEINARKTSSVPCPSSYNVIPVEPLLSEGQKESQPDLADFHKEPITDVNNSSTVKEVSDEGLLAKECDPVIQETANGDTMDLCPTAKDEIATENQSEDKRDIQTDATVSKKIEHESILENDRNVEDAENYENDEDLEDEIEESEEESPEFEKIGEVSPPRIERLVSYDDFLPESVVQQPEEGAPKTELSPLRSPTKDVVQLSEDNTEMNKSGNNVVEMSQQPQCKFLDPIELPEYDRKVLYFKHIGKLSPSKGKTKVLLGCRIKTTD